MNNKSSLIKIWSFFFFPIIIFNVLFFLIYNRIISFNFRFPFNAPEIDYLFYALLIMSVVEIILQLFILDKLNIVSVNNDNAPSEEKKYFGKMIIKMSFAVAPGIYCLIFFLLFGQFIKSLIFGIISLIMLFKIYFEIENSYNNVR